MAAGDDAAQERTHDATPRRLERARQQGDLPRSQDAQTLAAYLGLAGAATLGGTWSAVRIGEAMMPALATPAALARDLLGQGGGAFVGLVLRVLGAAVPLIALPAVMIVALLLAQGAFVVSPDKLHPKLSRLSPVANAIQKYGTAGLVEFAKSVIKVAAVAAVLAVVVHRGLPEIARMPALAPRMLGGLLAAQFHAVIAGVLIVAAAVAGLDLLWQNAAFLRRNRMTHEELKEEIRQAEGDPHIRAARRSRARELANQRMMLDVPKADVVIVNPTHYAVALRWTRGSGTAPTCVAKGVDAIALRIREIAQRAKVPVHEDATTARSLHALVEIGQEIRPEHYRAVAAAILFAERMRARAG